MQIRITIEVPDGAAVVQTGRCRLCKSPERWQYEPPSSSGSIGSLGSETLWCSNPECELSKQKNDERLAALCAVCGCKATVLNKRSITQNAWRCESHVDAYSLCYEDAQTVSTSQGAAVDVDKAAKPDPDKGRIEYDLGVNKVVQEQPHEYHCAGCWKDVRYTLHRSNGHGLVFCERCWQRLTDPKSVT